MYIIKNPPKNNLPPPLKSHHHTLTPPCGLARVARLLDLGDDELKRAGDVLVETGASLREAAFELVGEGAALVAADLPLLGFEVAFVADYDQGDPFCALRGGRRGVSGVGFLLEGEGERGGEGTRWFRILSRRTRMMSKDCLEATE